MERKWNKMKKSSIILAAIMVLSVFAVVMPANVAAEEEIYADEFFDVDVDEYVYIDFHATEGVEITVDITTDYAVDILLMDYADASDYADVVDYEGTFHYYVDGSALNCGGITYTFVIPKTGDYYIVVDNTDVPDDGAYTGVKAIGHVKVTYTLTPTPATPTPVIIPTPTPTPTPTPITPKHVTPTPTISTPTPETPGFEAIFAIAGLLAIAYLLGRRK